MRKIPTLFARVFEKHRVVEIKNEITPGCEEAFKFGEATVKIDDSCCAVIDGVFYKRYDAKKGKTPPAGAIPCDDPDPETGHWPHWVEVKEGEPSDKWFLVAARNYAKEHGTDTIRHGTYEAIGPHFNNNPYKLENDILVRHGETKVAVGRDYYHVKEWLEEHNEEGLVFWLDGKPVCKIKRKDFDLKWPEK